MNIRSSLLLVLGAAGLWVGMPNPVLQVSPLVLCYPAVLLLLGKTAKTAAESFRRGWLCGLLGSAACLYWLAIPVHDIGGLPWLLAVPCAILMGAYVGVYGGLFALVVFKSLGLRAGQRALILGLSWYLLELVRGWFCTGFPWLTLASAFAPLPSILQGASLIGGYGLAGLFVGLTVFAVEIVLQVQCDGWTAHTGRRTALLGGLITLLFCFGWWRLQGVGLEKCSQPTISMGLVQGNVDQNVKWDPAMQRRTVQQYLELSEQALQQEKPAAPAVSIPQFLIWPETAMPFNYQAPSLLSASIRAFVQQHQIGLLFGAPGFQEHLDGTMETFNRAYLLESFQTESIWYEKQHLVPFGEYLPPWLDIPALRPLLQGVGNFSVGKMTQPLPYMSAQQTAATKGTPQGNSIQQPLVLGMLICYESIFPELARQHVASGATVLINISNDAWFGFSSAPEQHLQLAQMRAIEQQRWIARATNTGYSAFIDPYGRITAKSKLFVAETLIGTIVPRTERTVYFYLAPWLPWIALIVWAGLCVRTGLIRRHSQRLG